jgi:hypothetical protein
MHCRIMVALTIIAFVFLFTTLGNTSQAQDTVNAAEARARAEGWNREHGNLARSPEEMTDVVRRAKDEEMMIAAAEHEAAENAAMNGAPKVPDADGKGWTQRSGNKFRGLQDGVIFKVTRIGGTEFYENSEGSTGRRTYDDKSKISRYVYVLPAKGFKLVGQDPYPENKKFKAWHKMIPLKQAAASVPAQTAQQPMFQRVGPYLIPTAAYGFPR